MASRPDFPNRLVEVRIAATGWVAPNRDGGRWLCHDAGVSGVASASSPAARDLETSEVHGQFERRKAAGARVVQGPYQPDEDPEGWIATFSDPDDNYFQLVSPFPG